MCLSRTQQRKCKQRNYGIRKRTLLQHLVFKPFAQLHLTSLHLQVVLLKSDRLTNSFFSLLPQATSLLGRLPNRYAHPGKYVCVCVGWLRKRSRCVFLNHISLLKQTGGGRSAYHQGLSFLFTVKSIASALTPHQLEGEERSLHSNVNWQHLFLLVQPFMLLSRI